MTPEDLATLHSLCFTTPRPWTAAEFADLLGSNGIILAGDRQGFILGRIAGPEAELLTIAVAPDARKAGIGRDLVGQYHTHASALGAEESFLEVAADNAPAIALYLASGYTQVGNRPRYYTTPDGQKRDALVFSRPLAT
ncbi:GNAT family N-acetyltransferase [Halocynthiibacter styelae]|uniref:GNAT family N-acetyltransferase n=1 Tax=Halocynthiibacter styelae TaxID=2761955 RepID=A0A8J7IDN5_9RHOB|nr:GNAT family N-acetyltransferase [Paenihalocynthiibacter styelae]MBI1494608.1 GNAT family N-acetyltransferase [Paenihalocynthiibacter styelae]